MSGIERPARRLAPEEPISPRPWPSLIGRFSRRFCHTNLINGSFQAGEKGMKMGCNGMILFNLINLVLYLFFRLNSMKLNNS